MTQQLQPPVIEETIKAHEALIDELNDDLLDFLNGLMLRDERVTRGHIKLVVKSVWEVLKEGEEG